MKILYSASSLYVKECEFGYGVFTKEYIPYNNLVHEAPYVEFLREECSSSVLLSYPFGSHNEGYIIMVLGYGCVFNHSDSHNLNYFHTEHRTFIYRAARDIYPEEQLFINYGENWWSTRTLDKA